MGTLGEDLASRLRQVLYRHQVELEPAVKKQEWPVSADPTIAYISRMLLEDEFDESEQPGSQDLVNELAELISPTESLSPEEVSYVDSPRGVDIHWTLLQCGRAVAASNISGFYSMAGELSAWLSYSQHPHGPLEKVAKLVLDALKARLTGTGAQACRAMAAGISSKRLLNVRQLNLPSSSASQVFANEMILRACSRAKSIHIVDYGILEGFQWPQLIYTLAQREGGPPSLRITGVEFPEAVEASQTGQRLMEYANYVGVDLEYCLVMSSSWEQVQPTIRAHEFLVVNSNLRFRTMKDDFVAVNNPRKMLFERVYRMKPELFVICEVSAALSTPFFIPRFEETLKLYISKMEYYEAWLRDDPEKQSIMEKLLAKSIMNAIACDGLDLVERAETYKSWNSRARRAGFQPVLLDNDVYEYVKSCWGGYKNTSENLSCGRDDNWMLLGWKNSVMLALSAWRSPLRRTP